MIRAGVSQAGSGAQPLRPLPLLLLLPSLLVVIGCTSVAPPSAPAPPPGAAPASLADRRAAAPAALAAERRWLQSWFQGTPVTIRQHDDGALAIEVPREFCFEPGRSSIKPPLAVVLDKVSESLRRRPQTHVQLLAAPDDASGSPPLGLQRAAQIQKHLVSRGVPAAHLGRPTTASAAAVQLRLEAGGP